MSWKDESEHNIKYCLGNDSWIGSKIHHNTELWTQLNQKLKTMKRNVLPIPQLCLYSQKDFQQDIGHSSDLDQKQSGILLTMKDLEENGIKSLN